MFCLSHWISQIKVTFAMLLIPLKSPWWIEVHWVSCIMCQPMLEKLLNIEQFFLLKIHLNQNQKLKGNLGSLLIFLESPHWVGFNEVDLEIFRSKVWGILNFECFLSLEIQLNYKKWFLKENLVECNKFTPRATTYVRLIDMNLKHFCDSLKVPCTSALFQMGNRSQSFCNMWRGANSSPLEINTKVICHQSPISYKV